MYTVAVKRDFIAQHYELELQLEGSRLDQHGYLVDIVEIERNLDALVKRYRDQTLNELPEFAQPEAEEQALNPSIEHFARILCRALAERIQASNLSAVRVKLWENQVAWAAYRIEL